MPDSVLLSIEEYTLLLLLSGKKSVYGFDVAKMHDLTEIEAKQAMFSLGRKGFLEETPLGAKMSDAIRIMITLICDAVRFSVIKRSEPVPATACLYHVSDPTVSTVVCAELIGTEGQIVRLSMYESEVECMRNKGFFLEEVIGDDSLYSPEELDINELPDSEADHWQIRLEDLGTELGSKTREFLFYKRPVVDLIRVRENNKTRLYAYSERLFSELLQETV